MSHLKQTLFSLLFFIPVLAHAQVNDVFDLQGVALGILYRLGKLFFYMAIAFFVWGVVKFIKNADDSTAREEGRKFIVWGIVSLVVIVSLWALVSYLLETLNILPSGATPFIDSRGNLL